MSTLFVARSFATKPPAIAIEKNISTVFGEDHTSILRTVGQHCLGPMVYRAPVEPFDVRWTPRYNSDREPAYHTGDLKTCGAYHDRSRTASPSCANVFPTISPVSRSSIAIIAGSHANRTRPVSSRPPSTRARRVWTPQSLRGSTRGRRRCDISVYRVKPRCAHRVRPPLSHGEALAHR